MTHPSDIQIQLQSTPDVASVALDRLRAIFEVQDEVTLPHPHPQHQVALQLTARLIEDNIGCPNCGFSRVYATEWMCPNCDATIRCDSDDVELIEVYNAWTIYAQNADGSQADQPIACHGRPQDWGDPRWTYNEFRFDWIMRDKTYINPAIAGPILSAKPTNIPASSRPSSSRSWCPACPNRSAGAPTWPKTTSGSKTGAPSPPPSTPMRTNRGTTNCREWRLTAVRKGK